jgi:transposase
MRGKKGVPHLDPADPPRRRGNKVRGHGTWDNDRPPVVGAFGRETGQARLQVRASNRIVDLQPHVEDFSAPKATVNTDEWRGYNRVENSGRTRVSVCHTPGARVWAKDLDADGIREVHVNTAEGFWTGLRNFLRPFRGINKVYLQQYVIMHEWAHNLKTTTADFLRMLCGSTQLAT